MSPELLAAAGAVIFIWAILGLIAAILIGRSIARMTPVIYATPFNYSTKEPTAASEDSGFDSLDSVVAALGDGYIRRGERTVIYGQGDDCIIFSDYAFRIDDSVIMG